MFETVGLLRIRYTADEGWLYIFVEANGANLVAFILPCVRPDCGEDGVQEQHYLLSESLLHIQLEILMYEDQTGVVCF